MSFWLFILVTATLFVRPSEIVPGLAEVPVYEGLIVVCLLVASPSLFRMMAARGALASQPITVCVLGVLLAIVLSHVAHAYPGGAVSGFIQFGKIFLYYLLLIGVVNSPARLRSFLSWLVLFILVVAVLALVEYHGIAEIPSITTLQDKDLDEETGETVLIPRLRSTGIFGDPNDLCNMLAVGMTLALYRLTDRRTGRSRFLWLAPLGLLGYGVVLTQSRGGLLALLAGWGVLFASRFGLRKTLLLGAAAVPLLSLVIGGRQMTFSATQGTGQERLQLWNEAISYFRESPLFGIGQGGYADRVGLVAHNSFLHAFTELGLVGGTFFVGAFFSALYGCWCLGFPALQVADPDLRRLRPYIMASLTSYAVGLISLTRVYVVTTYLVLALGGAYLQLAAPTGPYPALQFNRRLVLQIAGVSGLVLLCIYLVARFFVNRGGL
jgi:hypothetical protein